ncbi:MAG TPA: hypothetical protein VEA81_03485 [Burkholderiaceae bacterium]|nr:hypothetical protein [Burkholderiaceae bacterium]
MIQSGTPSPTGPGERDGNGSIGAPGHGAAPGIGSGSHAEREEAIGTGGPTGPGTMIDLPPRGATRDWGHSPTHERQGSEFGAFLDDLSELARDQPDDLRGELERRVSAARDRFGGAFDSSLEMSARARERVLRGLDHSRDAVVERPLSALAVAAIGGLLIGLLMSRRS